MAGSVVQVIYYYNDIPCNVFLGEDFFICSYRLVLSYLVHHGYTRTAEAFAHSTGLELGESVASILNRQSKFPGYVERPCCLKPSCLYLNFVLT